MKTARRQLVSEASRDAIRRRSVDRDQAKTCLSFLGQPMGRALHARLKAANESWKASSDDAALVKEVADLSEQFGKPRSEEGVSQKPLGRENLELICFEYVSG